MQPDLTELVHQAAIGPQRLDCTAGQKAFDIPWGGEAMGSWIWVLISLFVVVAVIAAHSFGGVQAKGHSQLNRIGGHREPIPAQHLKTAGDSTTDIRKGSCLENSSIYHGEMFFFCSIEERDTFTANLDQFGEYHPSETLQTPRTVERPI